MNKTQQILQERSELFDKEFGDFSCKLPIDWSKQPKEKKCKVITQDDIKSFHATTISLLLNSLKEEAERRKKELLEKININQAVADINAFNGKQMSHKEIDDVLHLGHYQALDNFSTLLSQTISNIQTK